MNLSPISSQPAGVAYRTAAPAVSDRAAATPDGTAAQNGAQATQSAALSPSMSAAAVVAPKPPEAVSDAQRAADNARLDKAVEDINRFLKPVASSIQFSVDEESGRTLVKVIDTTTNDVLRQFPSKEALAMSSELSKLQGMLVREKA